MKRHANVEKATAPTATTTNNTSLNVAFTIKPDDHGYKDSSKHNAPLAAECL